MYCMSRARTEGVEGLIRVDLAGVFEPPLRLEGVGVRVVTLAVVHGPVGDEDGGLRLVSLQAREERHRTHARRDVDAVDLAVLRGDARLGADDGRVAAEGLFKNGVEVSEAAGDLRDAQTPRADTLKLVRTEYGRMPPSAGASAARTSSRTRW
jgi:hypothetical protein